ncbi:uncharacterized protein LOC123507939 [Portunus trituberculatus]|uniref:uncharacterized protein LOC123507939 n=1 Tax=Portunus trituberculatus TaxID=210409 RepID=UPI001E1D02EB|nr:uncharacterized protein LOC123507939 [Portunus trituberculatus]
MVISQIFKTLDSLLDSALVDDSQIGEFRDRSKVRAAEAKIKASLENDKNRLKELLEERHKILTRVPLIIEAIREPKGPPPEINISKPEILDHKLLQVFRAKCKAHKVTFNSGFIGVMRVALMELVREAGIVRNSYNISTLHPINTRRYMSNVTSMVWAFHGMPMTLEMATPWDARNNFWKHVVDIDTKFREHIKKMGPVEDYVLDTMLKPMLQSVEKNTIYDMVFTNTWSPTIITIGNGKHVQMSHFHFYTSLKDLEYKLTCGIFGFKTWVQSQLIYSSEYITKENVVKLSERMTTEFNDTVKTMD